MKKQLIGLVTATLMFGWSVDANSTTYYGYNDFGGTWYDAEKTVSNTEDDFMCWAAASSNILAWTGWGSNLNNDADIIFGHYQNHWTDAGGLMEFGWEWWFDGSNNSQGWTGWSQEDVDGGGGFFDSLNFADYYHLTTQTDRAMSAIDDYLHLGYGVSLAIYTAGGGGHAITTWGYDYDEFGDYLGVWITDSDDSKTFVSPPDSLAYYNVTQQGDQWFLDDYYGTNNTWYIGEVQALDRAPVPEPATILLFGTGLVGLAGSRLRKKK